MTKTQREQALSHGVELRILPPVKEIFPSLEPTLANFRDALAKLSRTDAAFHIARLGMIVSRVGRYSFDEAQLRALTQIEPSKAALANLKAFELSHHGEPYVVCSRAQLMELLRWVAEYCSDHPDDGHTFEDEFRRDALFAALLFAGEIWSRGAHRPMHPPTGDREVDLAQRVAITRRNQTVNGPAPEFHQLFGRSHEIYMRHMPTVLPDFSDWFREGTGLELSDFLTITVLFYFYYIEFNQSQPEGLAENIGVFRLGDYGDTLLGREKIDLYLERFSQTIEDIARSMWPDVRMVSPEGRFMDPPQMSLQGLRLRPILRASDGRGVVVDTRCFSDFLLVAPLFHVPPEKRLRALAEYGRAFELYSQAVFGRIIPNSDILVSQRSDSVKIQAGRETKGEFDVVVSYVHQVLVIEVKHAFIPDRDLEPGSEHRLLNTMRERYSDTKKGVGQIARSILTLANLPASDWPPALKGMTLFYPILVSSDPAIDAFSSSELARVFWDALELGGEPVWTPFPAVSGIHHRLTVAPLAVLNINDLETLERMTHRSSLLDIFGAFALEGASASSDFRTFLSRHRVFSKGRRWNPHLKDVADAVIDGLTQLFPQAENAEDIRD